MPKIHELKTRTQYFEAVVSGAKKFEIRKNDRDFKVGDFIKLNEYSEQGNYTGKSTVYKITYILTDPEFMKPGYAALSIIPCTFKEFCKLEEGSVNNET